MLYCTSYVDFKVRLLTLKVIQSDETSTALCYYSNVRTAVTMQLNLRQPPMRSSEIINYTICKKKTKNYPS